MSVQPVVAHADSQTSAHPEQENRNRKGRPAEGKERRYGTEMENSERDKISPVDFPGFGYVTRKGTHRISHVSLYTPKLTGIREINCNFCVISSQYRCQRCACKATRGDRRQD